jgi:hypothetical protein
MEKDLLGLCIIIVVSIVQVVAWTLKIDGGTFAFTSLVIGTIAGSLFGFKVAKKQS